MKKKLFFLMFIVFSYSNAIAFEFDDLIENTKKNFSNFSDSLNDIGNSIKDIGNSIKDNVISDTINSSCQNENFTYEDSSDFSEKCLPKNTIKRQKIENANKTFNAKKDYNAVEYKNIKKNIPSKSNKKPCYFLKSSEEDKMEIGSDCFPGNSVNNGLVKFFDDFSDFVSTIGDSATININNYSKNSSCLTENYTYEDTPDNCDLKDNFKKSNPKITNEKVATFDTKSVSAVAGGIKIEKFIPAPKNKQTETNISVKQKSQNEIDVSPRQSKCNFSTFSSEEIDGMDSECFPPYRRGGALLSRLEIKSKDYKSNKKKISILEGAFGVKFGQKLNINSMHCDSLKDNFCELTPNQPAKGWTNYSALIDPISQEIAAISAIRENKTPKSHHEGVNSEVSASIKESLGYKQLDSCRMTKHVFDALEFKYKELLNNEGGFEKKSYLPKINLINKSFNKFNREALRKSKKAGKNTIITSFDQNKMHCDFSTYSSEETETQDDCIVSNRGFWQTVDNYLDDTEFNENKNYENNEVTDANQYKIKDSLSQESEEHQIKEQKVLLDNLNDFLKLMASNDKNNAGYLKNNNYKIDVNCLMSSKNTNFENKVFTIITYTDLNREALAKNNIKNYKKIRASNAKKKNIRELAEGL
jgi:hypothetical protein